MTVGAETAMSSPVPVPALNDHVYAKRTSVRRFTVIEMVREAVERLDEVVEAMGRAGTGVPPGFVSSRRASRMMFRGFAL